MNYITELNHLLMVNTDTSFSSTKNYKIFELVQEVAKLKLCLTVIVLIANNTGWAGRLPIVVGYRVIHLILLLPPGLPQVR